MFRSTTKKRILEHKWNEHSNKSQFFLRIKNETYSMIEDLTLLANELGEEQLQEIFPSEKLEPFIKSLMSPRSMKKTKRTKTNSDRIFFLGHMFLHWSLNRTGTTLDNPWAKKLYQQHEIELRDILESLYYERKKTNQSN